MAEDRLHEPFRAAHFPQLPELIAAAVAAGARGAALSGAGSTVIALCDNGVAQRVGDGDGRNGRTPWPRRPRRHITAGGTRRARAER